MDKISFYGLNRFYTKNVLEISKIIHTSFKGGSFIDGTALVSLESSLAKYCGRKYCSVNSSGTDSLFFALKALDIKENDEVLVPAISFIATATAVIRAGAVPVFVDVLSYNGLMDLDDAKHKISTKTRAVLFVDLYGNIPEVSQLEEFAASHNLLLIEDAAQSFGSLRGSRKAGSIGDVSILSFDPTKPVGAFGTGGAVLSNNTDITAKCTAYRQNGKNPLTGRYDMFGINSRMSESQAALVEWQLNGYSDALKRRAGVAQHYYSSLKTLPFNILVKEQLGYSGNFHKFVIATAKRDSLLSFLKTQGIETKVHYGKCLYEHPVLEKFKSNCPNAGVLTGHVLSLPFYPELANSEIEYICDKLKAFYS